VRRISRRQFLRGATAAGVGLAASWATFPRDAKALLCPCDTWNCGMFRLGGISFDGRTITAYGHVYGRGEMDTPVRVKVSQSSTGAVVEGNTIITGTLPPTGETLLEWSTDLTIDGPATFQDGAAYAECWLNPDTPEEYPWGDDLELVPFGDTAAFRQTWLRTDKPVYTREASRTWLWGPEAFTAAIPEEYAESPGGIRTVQYYDKSRMEITHPAGDPSSIWYVTNGLLVTELITGRQQVGDAAFIELSPAQVNVAGDTNDVDGPTYATFGALLDAAPLAPGTAIRQRLDRAGNVSDDPALEAENVIAAVVDDVTNHAVAAPFWAFMNAAGTIWENGAYRTANLFANPYYATGRPISEPYWADVKVGGTVKLVLVQCFERRCLTYTSGNPEGWQVEAGNVGRHYHSWRYQ
jgi:hypothetical protein